MRFTTVVTIAVACLLALLPASAQYVFPPASSGGSGTPGGSIGQIQYNNAGAFGGLSIGSGLSNSGGALIADTSLLLSQATAQAGTSWSLVPASASATTYTTTATPSLTVYRRNQAFQFTPDVACGVAPTVNIDGLGPIALKKISAGALAALTTNDCLARVPYQIRAYASSGSTVDAFILSPDSGVNGGAVPVSAKVLGTNSSSQPIAVTASHISDVHYAAGGGTAQAQTATYTPANAALTPGLRLCWLPTAANSAAAPTFAPDGLTAHTVVKAGGALIANDIITTAVACAVYDTTGTQWELQNPQTVATGATPGGSTNDVQVNAGSGAFAGGFGVTMTHPSANKNSTVVKAGTSDDAGYNPVFSLQTSGGTESMFYGFGNFNVRDPNLIQDYTNFSWALKATTGGGLILANNGTIIATNSGQYYGTPDAGIRRDGVGGWQFNNSTANTFTGTYIKTGRIQAAQIYTVATLPTCNGAAEGTVAGVSDLLTPTFLTAATGGGTVHGPVYCNGTAWVTN